MTKAMILAAGKGTRLFPLTGEIPKPMAPVADTPVLQHILELLARSGMRDAYVNVHHLADVVLGHYGREARVGNLTAHFSLEEDLLGTAGSVKRLAEHFPETFVVVMGDVLTDADLREIVRFHKERGAVATVALKTVGDTSGYGVVELDAHGYVVGFQEKPEPSEARSDLANTGTYVLEPEVLGYVPEGVFFDFAKDLFPRLLAAGEPFVGYEAPFYWSDIGTLDAYRAVQRDALSGKVRIRIPGKRRGRNVWAGQDARVHPTVCFEGGVLVGRDAVVDRYANLTGGTTIGAGSRVSFGATIRGSILLPGASVGEQAHLEDCIVGPRYIVRPRESIRGGALVRGAG